MQFKHKLLATVGLCLPIQMMSLVGGAQAQAPAQDREAAISEIVVTARNRSERLQEVPLAISALTGEQITKSGIRDLKDVATMTPALIINGGGAEFGTAPAMRGLVSLGGTADPTVATFYDGAYLLTSSANNIAMLDLDRIEIVKGPVNSLYGRPAYAGAINYISRMPTDEAELHGSVLVGNDGQRKVTAAGGFALIPGVLKVRAAAGFDSYAGGYTDKVNGLKAGDYTKKDAQISFAFTPTDNFTAQGRYYYGDDSFGNIAMGYADNNCGPAAANIGLMPAGRSFYCGKYDPDQHPVEVHPDTYAPFIKGNDRRVDNAFLRLRYDAGFAELTSLTTYTKVTQFRFEDFFGRRAGLDFYLVPITTPQPATPPAPFTPTVKLLQNFGSEEQLKDFAQEFRITSKQDQKLRWNAGVYYAKFTSLASTTLGLNQSKIPAGFTISGNATTCAVFVCDRVFLSPNGNQSLARSAAETESKLQSGFAGAEYDIVDKLTFTIDGRYSSDKRTVDNIMLNSAIGVNRPLGPPRSITFKNWTYRGSLKYKITSDSMVYATIANGVKAGGFNQRATHVEELPFGVEKNITYEAGVKNSFLNNRATLNASVFYIKLDGLQLQGPSNFADTIGLVTKNIGGATSKGIEFDGSFAANDWLTLRAGGSYTDATINDGTYDFNFQTTCAGLTSQFCDQSRIVNVTTPAGVRSAYSLGGLQIRGQAKYIFSASADVNLPLNDDWSLFGSLRYRYQSKQYANVQDVTWWGSLNKVDVRVGVEKGPMRITAFADNATNNNTPDSVYQSTYLNDFSLGYNAAMPMPRRFGIVVDYKFF